LSASDVSLDEVKEWDDVRSVPAFSSSPLLGRFWSMIFHSYISLEVIDCYEVELNSLLLFLIGLLLNDTLAPVSLFKGSFSSSSSSTYLTLE